MQRAQQRVCCVSQLAELGPRHPKSLLELQHPKPWVSREAQLCQAQVSGAGGGQSSGLGARPPPRAVRCGFVQHL